MKQADDNSQERFECIHIHFNLSRVIFLYLEKPKVNIVRTTPTSSQYVLV